jgi:transcriptional regulator with XRE-family HTH domain
MKKIPQYIIDKAIELRVKHKMTVPEIAECLGYSKSTVNGWMENYPLEERTAKQGNAQIAAAKANRENAAKKRQQAYDEAWEQVEDLMKNRHLRDFVCMYIGEGSKRNRNGVEIANSNAKVILLGNRYIKMFMNPANKIHYSVQIHEDHDEQEIKNYWANLLGIDPDIIAIKRKSNSGQLSGRQFRSQHGVFSVRANDTYFRSRLEAWMEYLLEDWSKENERA